MRHLAGLSLLLAAVVAVPVLPVQALQAQVPGGGGSDTLVARKGGGGGGARRSGGGGGGVRRPSGGGGPSGSRTGFSGASGGLNRGSSRPSGGWSQGAGSGRATPTLNRPSSSANRNLNHDGNRNLNRDGNRSFDRNVNRSIDRNIDRNIDRYIDRNVNRNVKRNVDWNRRVNINDVNINAGWARPGWGYARPWNTGWYGGWSTPSWGWWGANAAARGITSLATAAVINSAVNNAVDSSTTYIVVPNTNYELLYGSVQPSGSSGVSFAVTADGSTYQLSADCNRGTIDGRPPTSAEEAELLNAACQVAFGSV